MTRFSATLIIIVIMPVLYARLSLVVALGHWKFVVGRWSTLAYSNVSIIRHNLMCVHNWMWQIPSYDRTNSLDLWSESPISFVSVCKKTSCPLNLNIFDCQISFRRAFNGLRSSHHAVVCDTYMACPYHKLHRSHTWELLIIVFFLLLWNFSWTYKNVMWWT